MNSMLRALKEADNYTLTENGATSYKSTLSAVYDMFALCGAYRNRSEEDCILMFKNALEEDANLAMKCLFYLGDVREGQGERRYFRVCFNWLANNYSNIARKNLRAIPIYKRWDDVIYSCIDTPVWKDALAFIKEQLILDLDCQTPSLLAKWLPSENASSATTKELGNAIRSYLGLTHKQYRVILSILRSRINVLEKLMSENKWDQIRFDAIPSKAGLKYKNAFAKHDIDKRYEEFAKNKETKVNADVLNPVDIAHEAFFCREDYDSINRIALNKYWENLKNYYNGKKENGLCIVDVSGSMTGLPMEAAVSMGAYIAEHGHGPFANHFITFSSRPKLVAFNGIDIVDKLNRCRSADWGYNTNIEAVFNLLLNIAKKEHINPEDLPTRLYIFSDMEFDEGLALDSKEEIHTLLESIAQKWEKEGYKLPQIIFWNLDARNNLIPAIEGRFAYISGFSMSMIESILSGKDGYDLMLDKLNSERYEQITA